MADKLTLEAKVGIFFLVGLAIFAYVWFRVLGLDLQEGFELKTRLSSAEGLVEGTQVQIAGIKVGKIKSIVLDQDTGKAIVTMDIRSEYRNSIPEGSRVMVRTKGLLGDKYVVIEVGKPNARKLKSGEEIKLVYEPVPAEKVMDTLGFVAEDLKLLTREARTQFVDQKGSEKVDRIITNTDRVFQDVRDLVGKNKEKLDLTAQRIAQASGDMSEILSRNKEKINRTVDNVDKSGEKFNRLTEQLENLVGDVRAGRGTLGKLVTDESLYRQTQSLVVDMRQLSDRVQRGPGVIGRLINDPELYFETRRAIRNMNKTAEDVSEATPISTLAIILGSVLR
jgi:phospholipid/cholesterol/gamma-HCH transport system substrate-binding protein